MKMRKILLYSFAALLGWSMQSCFVAKEYQRPELEEFEGMDLYRTAELPQDSTTVAEIPWETFVTDTLLYNHIKLALENNPDIRVASDQVLIAEAMLRQGEAGYLPTVSARVSTMRRNLPDDLLNGILPLDDYGNYTMVGNLSWEADIWGKIRSNKRALEAGFYKSQAVANSVKANIAATIAKAYFELLSLDEKLAIVQRAVEVRGRGVEAIKGMKDAGMANEVAVLQIQALQFNAEAQELQIMNRIRLLENTFCFLQGREPQTVERSTFRELHIDADLKTGIPYALLQNRPDIMAAELGVREAFEMTNVARSMFYPSLTVNARATFLSRDLEDWFSTSSLFSMVMAGLTQPIFQQRKIRTNYEMAQLRQHQAVEQFRKTLLQAGQEVSNAMYNYEAATQLVGIKEKELESNQLAARYSAILLSQGMADYLELLTANTNELITEFQVVDAKILRFLTIIEFYRALGGFWR